MQCKSSGATYAHFLVEFCKKWIQVCEFVKVEGMSKAECPSDSSMPSKW